jgi:hypothetical protein
METAEKPSEEQRSDPSGVQAAIERYRDLAKYLITIFAGVGGLLVAGTQLSAIGALSWEDVPERVVAAGIGFLLAIVAVIYIIQKVLRVLSPVELSLDMVVEEVEAGKLTVRKDSLEGFASVRELRDFIDARLSEKRQAEVEALGAAIVDQGAYDKIKRRFERARKHMLGGALAGTIGIVAFSWGANPPKEETADPISRPVPVEVQLSLTDSGKEVLEEALGKSCNLERVTGLSIGGTETSPRVVVLPRAGCKPAQFSLSDEWGSAISTREAPSKSGA